MARCCDTKHISKSKCAKHLSLGALLEVAMSKKVHGVVARSTFPSQNVQNTPCSDNFWKLRFPKSARRCGAKHISKSKVEKTAGYIGVFCTLSKVSKNKLGFVAISTATTTTLHYTPLNYITLHLQLQLQLQLHLQLQLQLHYTTLITLHYATLRCAPLRYTTLRYTTLHHTTLHYTTLHYTTLHSFTLNYTTLHSATLHYTTATTTARLHYTTLRYSNYITLHYTPLSYNYNYNCNYNYNYATPIAPHYAALHSATLHYNYS